MKYDSLAEEMSNPDIISDIKYYTKIAKEHKSLDGVVTQGKKYISQRNQLEEYEEVLNGDDDELKELIKNDINPIKIEIDSLEKELKILNETIEKQMAEHKAEMEVFVFMFF